MSLLLRARRLLRRHYRLSINGILFGVVAAWLGFQLFAPTHMPSMLNQMLPLTFGGWLTNLAYEDRRRDDRIEHRVGNAEAASNIQDRRLHRLEGVATKEHPDDYDDESEHVEMPSGEEAPR